MRDEYADCVVYGFFCPWGQALAGILGLPALAFMPSYAMTENFPLVRRLSSILEEQTSSDAEEAMSDFRDVSRQLHDRYGLAQLCLMDITLQWFRPYCETDWVHTYCISMRAGDIL